MGNKCTNICSAELAWSQLPLPDNSPLVHECCSSCKYITCLQRYKTYLNILCTLTFSSLTGCKAFGPTALSHTALIHTLWPCTDSWESSVLAVCWKGPQEDARLLLRAECNALQHNYGCEHCAGAVLILRPAVGLSNAAEVVWCLTVLQWERRRCEAWQGVISFVMQSIRLDEGWRLGSLFIMHAFEYLENSSVNHTCSVRAALVLGLFTFRRSYLIFWRDNFKFHNVANAF